MGTSDADTSSALVATAELVVVADSSFAALEFLASVSQLAHPVAVIPWLRLDAALYEPPPTRQARQMGRSRLKGKRLPTLATVLTNPSTEWQSVTIAMLPNGYSRAYEFILYDAMAVANLNSKAPPKLHSSSTRDRT